MQLCIVAVNHAVMDKISQTSYNTACIDLVLLN